MAFSGARTFFGVINRYGMSVDIKYMPYYLQSLNDASYLPLRLYFWKGNSLLIKMTGSASLDI